MTLKSGDNQQIQEMMERLQREVELITNEVIELAFHMRGTSYEEMLCRTPGERQMISTFLTRHFEAPTKAVTTTR